MFRQLTAALTVFTRIPLGRIASTLPSEAYSDIIRWWPWTGWLTTAVTAGIYWLLTYLLPPAPALSMALGARVLLTGALHDDGLADYADAMGSGAPRERALEIMKDSHIGTMGVLALLFLYLIDVTTLASVPDLSCVGIIIAADPWSKFCAGRITSALPYARQQSRNTLTYPVPDATATVIALFGGLLPLAAGFVLSGGCIIVGALAALAASRLLFALMRRRLGGYTGDCCGATFLICETTFFVCSIITYHLLDILI